MQYNQDMLQDMAEKIDLKEYAEKILDFKKHSGVNYYAECCFHMERTPSLCFNTETNRYHCFGCGASGNIYSWMQSIEGLTFPEAVEKVAQIIGVEAEDYVESETVGFYKELQKCENKPTKEIERRILNLNDDYLGKYSDRMPDEWLQEGITKEAMKEYMIRMDDNSRRIVYPVFDSSGNLVSVKGRTTIPAWKELGLPKYINYMKIGELDYFQGWQQALPEIIHTKSVIIFEGIKSCMKSWGWGIRNTVASETSDLSEQQVALLIKTKISEIIIAWDNDQDFRSIVVNPKIRMLKNFAKVSVIKDKNKLLGPPEGKMAPVDAGEEIYKRLLEERMVI